MTATIISTDGSVFELSSAGSDTGTAAQPFAGLATAKSAAIAYMIAADPCRGRRL